MCTLSSGEIKATVQLELVQVSHNICERATALSQYKAKGIMFVCLRGHLIYERYKSC